MIEYLNGKLFYASGDRDILTPEAAAQNVIDLIPNEVWSNKDIKLLDMGVKSGIFLKLAHKRYMQGLSAVIPNELERNAHIWKNQIYGISTSKSTLAIVRMELYGDFRQHGNIIYVENYNNKLKDHRTAEITKEFGENMKFDVIIGNPPYQEMTGGGDTTKDASPLYNRFIKCAIEMKPRYICMIIPSRWMSGGKIVLDSFRNMMIEGKHLRTLVNYQKASDVFDGVDIAGGVQYFLWDSHYSGKTNVINKAIGKQDIVDIRDLSKYTYKNTHDKEQYMIIIDNTSARIVDKLVAELEQTISNTMLKYNPFELLAAFEDSAIQTETDNIKVICSGSRETWTNLSEIATNRDAIGKWKVCVAKVSSTDGILDKNGFRLVISKPFIAKPNEVCTISYFVMGVFSTEKEAMNCISYMKTKFVRQLIFNTFSGMNLSSRNFMFVPVQDYSKPWTDAELYKKYNLTDEEITYIESRIKAMV